MLRRLVVPALLASAMAVPAIADDGSRYSEWQPEGAEAADPAALEALSRELEALIDQAEDTQGGRPSLSPGFAGLDRHPRRRRTATHRPDP